MDLYGKLSQIRGTWSTGPMASRPVNELRGHRWKETPPTIPDFRAFRPSSRGHSQLQGIKLQRDIEVKGCRSGSLDTNKLGNAGWYPPIPFPHEGYDRRNEQRSNNDSVDDDADRTRCRHNLHQLIWIEAYGKEGDHQDQRSAGDESARSRDSRDNSFGGGARSIVLFSDSGKDKNLVIHGETEQRGKDDGWYPRTDGACGRKPIDEVRSMTLLPEINHEPIRSSQRYDVHDNCFQGQYRRAKCARQDDKRDEGRKSNEEGKMSVNGIGKRHVANG